MTRILLTSLAAAFLLTLAAWLPAGDPATQGPAFSLPRTLSLALLNALVGAATCYLVRTRVRWRKKPLTLAGRALVLLLVFIPLRVPGLSDPAREATDLPGTWPLAFTRARWLSHFLAATSLALLIPLLDAVTGRVLARKVRPEA
ncbi:MAG TPA: hypothetical protein VG870_06570 [Chitinophagaceae bacterium]|nr:hypothetical protein [Chitinophagaceae bacterium]